MNLFFSALRGLWEGFGRAFGRGLAAFGAFFWSHFWKPQRKGTTCCSFWSQHVNDFFNQNYRLMSSAKTLQQFVFVAMSKSFFWIGRVWVTFGRIWERSGKGLGDVWGFLPTSMSSKMDQKQLQGLATVRRAEKHLMLAKAKSRKRENESEIQ